MKRKMLFLLLVVCLVFPLCSCGNHYNKIKNPDLYTVANSSLLWTNGFSQQTDFSTDSEITTLEEDSFGRVLFIYSESRFSRGKIAFSSLLICQKTERQFVYYYPDYNFLSVEKDPYGKQTVSFSEKQIQQLKEQNDWEKELNLEKCVKKEISNHKAAFPKNISDEMLREFLSKQFENIAIFSVKYLTSDDYGRMIGYGWVSFKTKEDDQYFVMLFTPDDTDNFNTSLLIPSNYYDYQTELKLFKERNCWNEPIQ